ncbi:hypothetical protein V1507DRAFT_240615 [Lipomyces tetrasporus]
MMGIHQKLASFYSKQVPGRTPSQMVPSRRQGALPRDCSSSASSCSTSPSSFDGDDFNGGRVGNASPSRPDQSPRGRRSHEDRYPRIGYFHPQSNFIRARFPTPRGPQPNIEAFTSTAGQAAQLSASVPARPVRPYSAVILSKSVKKTGWNCQDGRRGTIKSVLTFGYRKGRRYGDAGDNTAASGAPMLPPIRFFSGGSLHITDRIGTENKTKEEEPKVEQVSVADKAGPTTQAADDMDTTQDEDFDTEEAIARLNSIVAASVAEANAAQRGDDAPTLWRRLSQKGRTSPQQQLQPNGEPSVKFNLPSPTMLNTNDRTSGFVNIPVASSDGSAAARNTNSILLSTVSHDISDDDFQIESPKSKSSKLEGGSVDLSPSRKLLHVSSILHYASKTIRRKVRNPHHSFGQVGFRHCIGNVDTGIANCDSRSMAGITGLDETVMPDESDRVSTAPRSLKTSNRTVDAEDAEDASFFGRLRSRVRAFVASRSRKTSTRTIKSDVPVTVQIEQLYSTIDNKRVEYEYIDDEYKSVYETKDDKLKNTDTTSGTMTQGRVVNAPVIDSSNLTDSDWDQMTPGTQTTFAPSPTGPKETDQESPKKTGTVRFNNLVEIMGEEDSFVAVETPIMRTPMGDDLSLPVEVLRPTVQQLSSSMCNGSDPFRSPVSTTSGSATTLISPRLL